MSSKKQDQIIEFEKDVSAPNYKPLPVVIERGEGVWLYDVDGNKYLDMMSAYSAVSHGHCHPELVKTCQQQVTKLTLSSRAFYNPSLGPFLKKICDLTGMDLVIPMNTGAEAVETAIKAARRWGYQRKKIPANKAEIIVSAGNFHGRTTSIISFSSEPAYKKDFGPLTPGFVSIPFGDVKALEKAITPNTCAFLTEAIQGEAGIIVPPEGWLKKVREICTKKGVLLIVDEVQSGLGRTGKLFAFQHDDILPDGVILGKALGGGIVPVSAFAAREDVLSLMSPGSHGSTFGGNALATTVGLKALEILVRDKYAHRAAEIGPILSEGLRRIKSPLIKDIRGRGLWIGLEIDPRQATARKICEDLVQAGLLSKETHDTVVRLAPPLTITRAELGQALEILEEVLTRPQKRQHAG